MVGCRNGVQCVKETNSTAAQIKSEDCVPTKDGGSCGHFSTEVEKVHRVETPVGVEREVPTRETVRKFYLVIAEIGLQLANCVARRKFGSSNRVVYDATFDAGELFQHLNRTDAYKRIL